jgi:hypothetical protein
VSLNPGIVVSFWLPKLAIVLRCLIIAMASEADTCGKFVVPKLQAAGWDADPHYEQVRGQFAL